MKNLYTFECPFCHHETTLALDEKSFKEWADGGLAQKCFPELSDEEREIVVSGLCFDCQQVVYMADDDADFEGEDFYEPDDFDLEIGFDIYGGCYDFDC